MKIHSNQLSGTGVPPVRIEMGNGRDARSTTVHGKIRRRHESGIALILTLAVLGILSLVVIGFLVSMRTEQISARTSTYVTMSRQLAHAALDDAIEMMRINMPMLTNGPPYSYYVTQPGRSVFGPAGRGPDPLVYNNHLDLLYPPITVDSVDLNSDASIFQINAAFTAAAAKRQVTAGWVYVLTNGTQGTTVTGTAPLYGRYTFWVDDEGTKININAANKRQTSGAGVTHSLFYENPGDVDLAALGVPFTTASVASNSWLYGQTNGYFTTEQWQAATNVITALVYTNYMPYVSAFGLDDNVTPWGQQRVNLNAAAAAGPAGIAAIAASLNNGFMTNWFGMSLGQKYGDSGLQIAANIVDYINLTNQPSDSGVGWADVTPPLYLGLKVTPYISEYHVSNFVMVADQPSGTGVGPFTYTFITQTDIMLWNMYPGILPLGSGISALGEIFLTNRTSCVLTIGGVPIIPLATNINNIGIIASTNTSGAGGITTALPAYSTSIVSLIETIIVNNVAGPLPADTVTFPASTATAIYRVNGQYRIDYAQIPLGIRTIAIAPVPGDGHGVSTALYNQVSVCNDPRVKPMSSAVPGNWRSDLAATPTLFGPLNGVTNSTTTTIWTNTFLCAAFTNYNAIFTSDNDFSCHILSSISTPTPAGEPSYNGPISQKGFIGSLGELAVIHTGWPWRTFWLEPQPAIETNRAIPDWMVLDLFSVTNGPVAGRININAAITNLTSGFGGGYQMGKRITPMHAVFGSQNPLFWTPTGFVQDASTVTFNAQLSPAGNLVNTPPPNFYSNVFTFVGQICEVNGFIDVTGVGGTGANGKEERERPVRAVANLLSVRSSRFTVWGLAQSILDVNGTGVYSNGDQILSETKFQAVVERDPVFDATGLSTNVSYRTVYFRYLTP